MIIKEAKSSSWKKLCSSFNRHTPISRVWNYIRRFKRINTNRNISKNDEWIGNIIDKLAQTANNDTNIDLEYIFTSDSNDDTTIFLLQPFTDEEFNIALALRKNTTPGLDSFPYIMLQKLHISAKNSILQILNSLWSQQLIPESWKTQCVIPILKPDKLDDDPNSYRPISLASCIGKLCEQMIKMRLDYYVENKNIIPSCQFGFRKGKSAVESFTTYLIDMKNCLLSKSAAVCVFLDVQGAYDNVNLHQMAKVLHSLNLPGKLIKWLFNFSFGRTLYVKYNNILHGPKNAYKGLMQGASLSPILYNLYTSQILHHLPEDVKILQFADDILIYCVNSNVQIAQRNINLALDKLNTYYSNDLKLFILTQVKVQF